MEEERFEAVLDDPDVILWDGYMLGCLFYGAVRGEFGDGGVEVCDIELDEACVVLVGYSCEPVGDCFGVLPFLKL